MQKITLKISYNLTVNSSWLFWPIVEIPSTCSELLKAIDKEQKAFTVEQLDKTSVVMQVPPLLYDKYDVSFIYLLIIFRDRLFPSQSDSGQCHAYFIYFYHALIIFTNNSRRQTYPAYLPPHIFPTTTLWDKLGWDTVVTQLYFIAKVRLELMVSGFLLCCLNYCTKLALLWLHLSWSMYFHRRIKTITMGITIISTLVMGFYKNILETQLSILNHSKGSSN